MAEAIGQPGLGKDSRFVDFTRRRENRGELVAILDDVFASAPADRWVEALEGAGAPTGPVQGIGNALRHPQTEARRLVETDHPRFGTVRQIVSPVRVGNPDDYEYRRAPHRNEHGQEVLTELLGYSVETVGDLRAEGAFR